MHPLTRRGLLRSTMVLLNALSLAACSRQRVNFPPITTPTPSATASTSSATYTASTTAETPRRGGVLHFNLPGDVTQFDLHQATTGTDLWALAPLYDMLLQFDPLDQTTLIPDLAERYEVSDDGLLYTFYLRRGVKFHDGTPFTSKDVIATFKRIISPPAGINSPRMHFFAKVDSITALDDYTVQFHLKSPEPSLHYYVALPWCGILPAHLIDTNADFRDPSNLIGTGPFLFKSYIPGVALELVRNPDYYNPDLPYLDGITMHPFSASDQNAAIQAFLAGQLHFFRGRGTPPLDLLANSNDVTVVGLPTLRVYRLILNANNFEAWKDERVRRAVSLAFDRDAMIAVLNEGRGTISSWMLPDGAWALPEERLRRATGFGTDKTRDRQLAKELLAQAGFPNGFDIDMITSESQTIVGFVVDQLSQVGIRVNAQILSLGELVRRQNDGSFRLSLTVLGPWIDEPKATFGGWVTDDPRLNITGISSPDLILLYQEQDRELDYERRKALVNELDYRTIDEIAFGQVCLYRALIWYVYRQDTIGGWLPQPNFSLTEKHATTWLRNP